MVSILNYNVKIWDWIIVLMKCVLVSQISKLTITLSDQWNMISFFHLITENDNCNEIISFFALCVYFKKLGRLLLISPIVIQTG